jgi:hypothetical protein
MIKKFSWIGLMFIISSCAEGISSPAHEVVSLTPTPVPKITETQVLSTLTPSPALVDLTTITPTLAITQVPSEIITLPQPASIPYDQIQPSPSDSNMPRGKAFIDTVDYQNGYLIIKGNLPDPCHKLRVELDDPTFANNKIKLSIYSLRDKGAICIQSLAPFQTEIPLTNIRGGDYTVTINDAILKKFTVNEKQ